MSTSVAMPTQISFPVTGMTCASCVRRIDKALAKVEGVQEASVSLASEKARVVFDPSLASLEALSAAVQKAGSAVGEPPAEAPPPTLAEPMDDQARDHPREIDRLRRRWMGALPDR
jgi:P-type Cu+ transporter